MPKIPEVKSSLKLTKPRVLDTNLRPAIRENIGCYYQGALLPAVDYSHPPTLFAGIMKRFGTKVPDPDPALFKELLDFASWYVKSIFRPCPSSSDVSPEAWLIKCPNYSQTRKLALLKIAKQIGRRLTLRNVTVTAFCKDEYYVENKHARLINSRDDAFKCMTGPYFRLIEEIFYKHEDFVKKIPVAERPQALFDKLSQVGIPVQCMDFKAMESHFTALTFELEIQFYEYMTQHLQDGARFIQELRTVLKGINFMKFKDFYAIIEATRMSGEMNTSLGNAYVNWIISKFIAYKNGCLDKHRCFIEGDDSVVQSPYVPSPAEYKQLGFQIEMSTVPTVETGSFCGLIFDPVDRVNVTDPMQELITFGWTNRRYVGARRTTKLALLRCKSLSMLYQYQGCPILAALGRYGLRVTRRIAVDKILNGMNLWEKEQMNQALSKYKEDRYESIKNRPIGIRTRLLMETVFKVKVEDQLAVESYLDSLNTLEPLVLPMLQKYMHPDWIAYYDQYVVAYPKQDFERNFYRYPVRTWHPLPGYKPDHDVTRYFIKVSEMRKIATESLRRPHV